nr:ORF2 [Torque teno Leptonychotes weddellii virus 1]
MALCAATSTHGYPDLHHPLQFRKAEALWKQQCSLTHRKFCACGDYLLHFKWPSTGGGGDPSGDQNGGVDASTYTGEDFPIDADTGEKEDITDEELLQ